MAVRILHCGIRYGKAGLVEYAGEEVVPLIAEVFGELHKNNLPEEEFLFAVKKMFDRSDCNFDSGLNIPDYSDIDAILSEIREDAAYRADPRISRISDFRQKSVLRDFVYCLTQLFHADFERFAVIADRIRSR